jgi:hypothetical protein
MQVDSLPRGGWPLGGIPGPGSIYDNPVFRPCYPSPEDGAVGCSYNGTSSIHEEAAHALGSDLRSPRARVITSHGTLVTRVQ